MDDLDKTLPSAENETASSSSALDGGRFVPGTMLHARYRIVSRIGLGGMGEVYRAEDLKLGEQVALKFLPALLGRDRSALVRLHQEVRTARRVSHRNVVRVHDIGEAEGETFLSMELVSGEDLASLMNRIGRLPEEKGIILARQLCSGLTAAHEQGVLHRDLKPANVMIDGDGNVRISDFGLAELLAEQRLGELAGTPAYMAPEQLRGERLTVASEMFSLGLVLYEIFTGERLLSGLSMAELLAAHQQPIALESSRLANLDPAIVRVIERCLTLDPAQRPRSAMAVAAALPGGDPLLAALEAGETPSPAMVAEAAVAGTLTPWIARALVFVGISCLVAGVGFRTATSPFVIGGTALEPAVLDHQAGLYLSAAGGPPLTKGVGRYWIHSSFDVAQKFLPREVDLAASAVPLTVYTYRAGEQPIAPVRRWVHGVTWDEPPVYQPGTATVEMDDHGRLLRLLQNPSGGSLPVAAGEPDWKRWFEFSHLDPENFHEVEPNSVPLTWCDRVVSWEGYRSGFDDVPLRIDAATRGAALMHWEVRSPDADPAPRRRPVFLAGLVVFLVMLAGGGVLAWSNSRSGRTDQRGALVTAAIGGGLWVNDGLVTAGSTLFSAGLGLLLEILALGLLVAAVFWATYLALEPTLRRHLPATLVSWNRLLRGRTSDPLLARDLLFGSCAGLVSAAVGAAEGYARGWIDLRFHHGAPALWGLLPSVTNVLHPMALTLALGILFLFAAPRALIRSSAVATVVGASAIAAMVLLGEVGIQRVVAIVALIALARFVGLAGLWGYGCAMVNVSLVPVVWDLDSWWAPRSLIGPLVMVVLLIWSARTAAQSRP